MKSKIGLLLTFSLLVSLTSQMALAGGEGKKLHSKKCQTCHKNEVYQRKDRKVKTLAALKARVAGCASSNKAGWNGTQTDQVINYLNDSFYKFSVFE